MSERHPYEDDLNRSYLFGISSGWEEAANKLMSYAVESFKNGGRDADGLRRLADEFKRISKEKHPGIPARKTDEANP